MIYDFKKYHLLERHETSVTDDIDLIIKEGYLVSPEFTSGFSTDDANILLNVLKNLGDQCKTILEIGVATPMNGSTEILLNYRPKHCRYFGVDVSPDVLAVNSYKLAVGMNINSNNHSQIMNIVYSQNVFQFDLIHIDGNHSVNCVFNDWKYTEFLSSDGYVVLHDTNAHSGPLELIKYLDLDYWKIERYFNDRKDDWGIAIIRRK